MNKPAHAKKGFTLIEVLTVIAILAILGAIIFPTVGQFRTLAKKSSDSSDLRDIVQASLLFASQNGERLVGSTQKLGTEGVTTDTTEGATNTLVDVAAILAYAGDLTDPKVWVSANETSRIKSTGGLYTNTAGSLSVGAFKADEFSYSYVTGLNTFDSATTPVAYTRQTVDGSTWGEGDPYSTEGGHVAFLGGNVNWYEDLSKQLIKPEGTVANKVSEAVRAGTAIRHPVAAN